VVAGIMMSMISVMVVYSSLLKNVGVYPLISLFAQPVRKEESTEGNMACPVSNAIDWMTFRLFMVVRCLIKIRFH
jgi:hypothetical protein